MCTIIFWGTDKDPLLKYPIETVRQMNTLCNLYGWELEELLAEEAEEYGPFDLYDPDTCLCAIGPLDLLVLDMLGFEYINHDDGTVTVIDYCDPPVPPEPYFPSHMDIIT